MFYVLRNCPEVKTALKATVSVSFTDPQEFKIIRTMQTRVYIYAFAIRRGSFAPNQNIPNPDNSTQWVLTTWLRNYNRNQDWGNDKLLFHDCSKSWFDEFTKKSNAVGSRLFWISIILRGVRQMLKLKHKPNESFKFLCIKF